jgi:hypothetical protein
LSYKLRIERNVRAHSLRKPDKASMLLHWNRKK